jgi:hypothetical protein
MSAMLKRTIALLAATLTSLACAQVPADTLGLSNTHQAQASPSTGDLKYKVPDGWIVEKPTSSMRTAQYRLPKAEGDTEDAILVLYYFGQGQGGSAASNIDRWINQMQQADGHPSKENAKSETLTENGLKVSTVDVAGTYTAEMSPGSGTFNNKAGYRLRAAVVETPKGSYYVKLVGPEKTVGKWDEAYTKYVRSFEFR